MQTATQGRRGAKPAQPDVRPALGRALMAALARSLKIPVLRHLPVPMTQWLVGPTTSREIGLPGQAGLLAYALFSVLRVLVKLVDGIGSLFSRQFSISRLITRIMGYHLLSQLMLSQTRPLALPESVLKNLHHTMAQWGHDPKALPWLNRVEDRWTCQGDWLAPPAQATHPSASSGPQP